MSAQQSLATREAIDAEVNAMESPYQKVGYLKAVVHDLIAALDTIVDVAPGAGEDVSYVIARRALERNYP